MFRISRASSLAILFAVFIVSCQSKSPVLDEKLELTRIDSVMQMQENAWNAGDLELFMSGYWKSDSLRFVGKSGVAEGWLSTLSNYKKNYPNQSAMGRLELINLQREVFSNDHAYVIGKWQLFREADTLGGHYTLLWKKIKGQWLIVTDHSS